MVTMVDSRDDVHSLDTRTQARGNLRALGALLVRFVDIILDWQERAQQRRHLSGLDDHLLNDIGISRSDVDAESTKPFWKA